jgi:hypothetical protein
MSLDARLIDTIGDMKRQIELIHGTPVSEQCLFRNEEELEEDFTLKDYNIAQGLTMYLVRRVGSD